MMKSRVVGRLLLGAALLPSMGCVKSTWCQAVDATFAREGVECLALPGATTLGYYGPKGSPREYSLEHCLGEPPHATTTVLGNYDATYRHVDRLGAGASADLQTLSGLKWLPSVKAEGSRGTQVSIAVTLQKAIWRSVPDLGVEVKQALARTYADPNLVAQHAACVSVKHRVCDTSQDLLMTEEVIEAVPVLDVTSGEAINLGGKADWLKLAGGVRADFQQREATHSRITAETPVAIAARMRPAREVLGELCSEE